MMRGTHGVIASGYSTSGIPSDYIARYVFDGDYTDETGNYDGTNSGSSLVGTGNGPNGSDVGIETGGGNYVNLPTGLITALGAGSGTISFAVKSLNNGNPDNIISCADSSSPSDFYVLQIASDITPRIIVNAGNIVSSDTDITTNTWQHVILRTDGTGTTFRINGTNASSSVDAGSDTGDFFGDIASPNNIRVGILSDSTPIAGTTFQIAYLTLYDRELSDAECEELETEY